MTQALYYARASQGTPRPIESVRAELYRARDIASYDTSCIEVRLAGGARVLHVVSHAVAEQHDPVIHLECEHGTVDWAADGDVAAIRYADGREERFANPAFDDLQTLPLRQTARVAAGDEPFPTCGLSEAGSHVLAINLAFESSQGVHTIPSDGTRILEPSGIVAVREMEGALAEAYASGAMLSDLGLPWTRSTGHRPRGSVTASRSPKRCCAPSAARCVQRRATASFRAWQKPWRWASRPRAALGMPPRRVRFTTTDADRAAIFMAVDGSARSRYEVSVR